MRRIDADFERLQPVAVDMALERENVAVGRHKAVDFRKYRRLAFAEIGPVDSVLLDQGKASFFYPLAQLRFLRRGRRFQALARRVEQPAGEAATKPAVFQAAEREIGAAMGAMPLDQAVTG